MSAYSKLPTALVFSLGAIWLQTTTASSHPKDLRELCQSNIDSFEVFDFDNRDLIIGGVVLGAQLLYCIMVNQADQDYYIVWPDMEADKFHTTRDGIAAIKINFIKPINNKETQIFIGANYTEFRPRPPMSADDSNSLEPSNGSTFVSTHILGSVSNAATGTNIDVDLEFIASSDKDTCYFSYYVNSASTDSLEIKFQLPPRALMGAFDSTIYQAMAISDRKGTFSYTYAGNDTGLFFSSLTILDEKNSVVGSIPVIVCAAKTI